VSCSQILGMAAFLENRKVAVLDEIGLSQKNGGVVSQVNIASNDDNKDAMLMCSKIDEAETDLLLGLDMLTACTPENLSRLRHDTNVVLNTSQVMTGDFASNPDLKYPSHLNETIFSRITSKNCVRIESDLNKLSNEVAGDSVSANIMALGMALQKGLLPVSLKSLERAIELNGVYVDTNLKALECGRSRVAMMMDEENLMVTIQDDEVTPLDDLVVDFMKELDAWSGSRNSAASQCLFDAVNRFSSPKIRRAVCENYFKLLAFKDEYEVARLHVETTRSNLANQFTSSSSFSYSLGHEMFSIMSMNTSSKKFMLSSSLGNIIFGFLSRLRHIRGMWIDPFRFTKDRQLHTLLLSEYEDTLNFVSSRVLDDENVVDLSVEEEENIVSLLSYPSKIRGFGHIRERNAKIAREHREEYMRRIR